MGVREMRVLAVKTFADGAHAGQAGREYDLPDELALRMIACGAAVAVQVEGETAMVEGASETAMLKKPRTRGRRTPK